MMWFKILFYSVHVLYISQWSPKLLVCIEADQKRSSMCRGRRGSNPILCFEKSKKRNTRQDGLKSQQRKQNYTHTHCAVCRTEPTKPEGKYTQTAELGSVERSFFYILETNRFHMQMFFFVRNASVVLRFSFLRPSFFYLHSLEVICGFCCVPDFIFGTDSISAMHFFS